MMENFFTKKIILLFLYTLASLVALGQVPNKRKEIFLQKQTEHLQQNPRQTPLAPLHDSIPKNLIHIIRSDQLQGFFSLGKELNKLSGNVILRQNNIFLRSKRASFNKTDNIVSAAGEVIIQQPDTANVFADSVHYIGSQRNAFLQGDVVLTDFSNNQLFTNRLDYDLERKIGTYQQGGMLANDKSQLLSKKGYFYVEQQKAFFSQDVLILDDRFTLRADTLEFDTEKKIAYFIGPTYIVMDSITIYTEAGFYDTQTNTAEFTKNPVLTKGTQRATAYRMTYDGKSKMTILDGNAQLQDGKRFASANKIRYDEANNKIFLEGNALVKEGEKSSVRSDKIVMDRKTNTYNTEGKVNIRTESQTIVAQQSSYNASTNETLLVGQVLVVDSTQTVQADTLMLNQKQGSGRARGKVIWQDTINKTTIFSNAVDYQRERGYVQSKGRTLLITLLGKDSLYLAADTLTTWQQTKNDSTTAVRHLLAKKDVRIFNADLQSICDSLTYNDMDSIFYFYKNPVLWSDTSQFVADTILLKMKNKGISQFLLRQNALIINSPDEFFFNQIKGKNITAFFQSNKLNRMNVQGNAEAIYYALDDDGAYVGVNKTVCSDMQIFLAKNKIEYIDFYGKPDSTAFPMKKVNHDSLRVKGFRWDYQKRPRSVLDLNAPLHAIFSPLK